MTTTVSVTRRATFAAAHVLSRPEWDEERNDQVFGRCARDHGHNYVIEVTVSGEVNSETGMVANLKDIDGVIRRELIEALDHRHLNRDVEFLRGVIPTAENVAAAAWRRLEPHLPARLVRVRLIESENNSVEVVA